MVPATGAKMAVAAMSAAGATSGVVAAVVPAAAGESVPLRSVYNPALPVKAEPKRSAVGCLAALCTLAAVLALAPLLAVRLL